MTGREKKRPRLQWAFIVDDSGGTDQECVHNVPSLLERRWVAALLLSQHGSANDMAAAYTHNNLFCTVDLYFPGAFKPIRQVVAYRRTLLEPSHQRNQHVQLCPDSIQSYGPRQTTRYGHVKPSRGAVVEQGTIGSGGPSARSPL